MSQDLGIGGSSLHETDRDFCVRENGSHSQFFPLHSLDTQQKQNYKAVCQTCKIVLLSLDKEGVDFKG